MHTVWNRKKNPRKKELVIERVPTMLEPSLRMFRCDSVNGLPKHVVYCAVL